MSNNTLFIGWGNEDITPQKKVLLFGQFYERLSQAVHDPLMVTALAIENRNEDGTCNQAVMVSCDLVFTEKKILDRLRDMVSSELEDLDVNNILTFAIHTHTGPCMSDETPDLTNWTEWRKLSSDEFLKPSEYVEFLLQKMKKAVIDAWKSRKPSKVSWELGHAVVGHCRRVVYEDRAVMYGSAETTNFVELEAPSDHGIEMMYFWDMNDQLTGVIINVGCPAQVVESATFLSADYMGVARRKIQENYSHKVYVLPQIAPAGDQSPDDLIRCGKSENIRSIEGMEKLGSRVANEVIGNYESAKGKMRDNVIFKHKVQDILLPIRKVTQTDVEQAQQKYGELMKNHSSTAELKGWDFINYSVYNGVIQRHAIQDKLLFYKMELHAIRLGDTAFVTNPFELYIDYGLRIKARSRAVQTFAVQLSCDVGAYLPTRKAISGGSYGTNISDGLIGPEGGDLLVEHSVAAINSLWDIDGICKGWSFSG